MKCEVAERELSARLDGEADQSLAEAVSRHVESCIGCTAFAAGAELLREKLRLEVADPVPAGLLESIVDRVAAGTVPRPPVGWAARLRPAVAAFVLGSIGSAIVVGGLDPRTPRIALASQIPGYIAEASETLTEYRATFDIAERNFRPEVPVRHFESRIAFKAPEQFQARTIDVTTYPSRSWPANDVTLEVDGGSWRLDSPVTCPRMALPGCTADGVRSRTVIGREPFDADASLPSDIILPLRTLAGTDSVEVVGRERVAGRDAVQLRLDYADAGPLFAFLHSGGAWRPFHPQDEVILSLDRASWLPLRYEVRVSDSHERGAWSLAEGVTGDRPGATVFEATARQVHFGLEGDAIGTTEPSGQPRDAGFVDLTMEELARRVGYRPLEPAGVDSLRRYRTGTFRDPARRDEALVSYTDGLGWVKIRQTRTWNQPALFGNVGSLAQRVDLPDGGVGYYEPATQSLGRRLSLHSAGWDLYLESNLPPETLLEVAAAMPGRGIAAPRDWALRRWPGGIVREQVSLEEAKERAPYLEVPSDLPEGYEVAAVQLVRAAGSEGVTVFLRRPGMEPDGAGIRIHQSPSQGLPPPMDPAVSTVNVGKLDLRYSPGRGEVEWIEEGIYRSIAEPSLELARLVALAVSMQAAK